LGLEIHRAQLQRGTAGINDKLGPGTRSRRTGSKKKPSKAHWGRMQGERKEIGKKGDVVNEPAGVANGLTEREKCIAEISKRGKKVRKPKREGIGGQ